ncbi:MAG: hypothetical protein ABIQ59_06130 [Nocardioidaceae bacterium]
MTVVFQEQDGIINGIGAWGRRWRIVRTVSGWRLEFSDVGESSATYAGTHPSLASAMRAADEDYG